MAHAAPDEGDDPSLFKDPFAWYAMKSIRKPRTVFACAWFVILLMVGAGLPQFEQTESSDYDWLIGSSEIVGRSYSLKQVQERTAVFTKVAERSVKQNEQLIHFVFESRSATGNVLHPAMIKEMLEIEMKLFTHPDFAKFCVATIANVSNCSPATQDSIVTYFYDTSMSRDASNHTAYTVTPINDPDTGAPFVDTQAGVDKRMTALMADSATASGVKLFLDRQFTAASLKSFYVQSFYFLGMPLEGYANPADRSEDQREPGDEFVVKVSDGLKEQFGLKETFDRSSFQTEAIANTNDGALKVYWSNDAVQNYEWETLSDKDLGWTILSIVAVGAYTTYHTGSVIISAASMLMTVLSIFVGYFWFRMVFQISYFQFINFLIIFVVLGIGADDVFVFMDAYHQSFGELRAEGKPATLQHRLTHTMKRAVNAIFVTSFTTAAAFLATAISPIMPLRSFGIFSALVIFSVFMVNSFVLPPLTVMYMRNLDGRSWIECFKAFTCGAMPIEPYIDPGLTLPVATDAAAAAAAAAKLQEDGTNNGDGLSMSSPIDRYNPATMRRTERFFYLHYYKFLMGPAKYVILVLFTALFAVGIVLWIGLTVPREQEAWFPKSHMFQQYSELFNDKVFPTVGSANLLKVNILWGLNGLDKDGINTWIPDDLGKVRYDASFDPSDGAAQAWIMQSYEKLKTAPCNAQACGDGLLSDPAEPIKNILAETDNSGAITGGFYHWLMVTQGAMYAAASPTSAPVTGDTFNSKMCEYSKLESTKLKYAGHVGFYAEDCNVVPAPTPAFILIEATANIRLPQAAADFEEAQEIWEAFGDSVNVGAPVTMSGATATSTNINWLWSLTSLQLMQNVYNGLSVCFPMVFVVLTLSTSNVLLALYSTITIAGIVTSVIGIGVGGIMGWDLGITEAIATVIVIGFSVDYCVHLANAYIESGAEDRETRTRIALTTMGISVTAGAITTIVAGAFLGLCILTFFVKFSFLICWTIICSYVWAVVFFGALCITAGPSGKFGDVSFITKYLKCSCKRA
eukprot:CAMPEP_0197575398 /NCGR_PEP_ID=MMETSP1326-20131121/809_1 /TAXON_ID=1155430 /ORGANISM="Genus nov. species nov., Strain RCC2288" /LENGTH=1027 /DNA_ID=CAMNT_0043138157 /DNA_START=288 /DNA_END=3371 /DNA_ORIENTATION=+